MFKFALNEQSMTPVPTLFLKKHMVKAPEKYLKVYLYGLYLASTGDQLSDVELVDELQQTAQEVEEALEYWATKGLVQKKQTSRSQTYEFVLSEAEISSSEAEQPAKKSAQLYEYQNFNNMLGTLLNRTLSANELERIYDFTEVYGLPQDVVISMIEYCVTDRERGSRVSISYLDKVAQTWAEEGVTTRERAQETIEAYQAKSSGANKLMKLMGLHGKFPGKTEMDYYDKWTSKWGFTHDAIEYCMRDKEFSGGQPFKYLDAILRDLYERGITTARKISEFRGAQQKRQDNMKEILRTLEYSRIQVSPKCESFYDAWNEAGFALSTVLIACRQSIKYGSRKLESVDALLREWKDLDLGSDDEIQKYLRRQNTIERKIRQVYECAGIQKTINEVDIKNYRKYTEECGMPQDVLMYVAEISSIDKKREPYSYMYAVLADWADKGVDSLEKAKKQNLRVFNKENKKNFEQHDYAPAEDDKRELDAFAEMETLNAK